VRFNALCRERELFWIDDSAADAESVRRRGFLWCDFKKGQRGDSLKISPGWVCEQHAWRDLRDRRLKVKATGHLYSLDSISEGEKQVGELFEGSVIGAGGAAYIDRVFDDEDVASVEGAGVF